MGSYVHIILTAVIAFPFIAFLFTFPYIIYNYRKYGSVLSFRILVVYSFILYLLCVYFLVHPAPPLHPRGGADDRAPGAAGSLYVHTGHF